MTSKMIETYATTIVEELSEQEHEYARTESARRTAAGELSATPFSCLHDLMDANELLPADSIDWDAVGGPDCTAANQIMDAVNAKLLS